MITLLWRAAFAPRWILGGDIQSGVLVYRSLLTHLIPLSGPVPAEERVVGPRDLQVSELAHSSLRLTWSQATSDVTGYRLLVTPLSSKGQSLQHQQRWVGLNDEPTLFSSSF